MVAASGPYPVDSAYSVQVRRIEAMGGNIVGGRLVSGLQTNGSTGDVTAVVSRDRAGNETVHPADAVVFAIGIGGEPARSTSPGYDMVFKGSRPLSTLKCVLANEAAPLWPCLKGSESQAVADVSPHAATGMQKLVAGCPELGSRAEFARIANLRSIDCIATRLWFDRRVSTRFPANVLSGFEECTGGTWFNLNDLQV